MLLYVLDSWCHHEGRSVGAQAAASRHKPHRRNGQGPALPVRLHDCLAQQQYSRMIAYIWSTTRTDGPGRHAEPWAGRLRWRHRRRWSTGAPCRSSSLPVWAKRNQTLTVSARSALALAQVRWIGCELNTFRPLASSYYLLRRRHHYGWHVRSVAPRA